MSNTNVDDDDDDDNDDDADADSISCGGAGNDLSHDGHHYMILVKFWLFRKSWRGLKKGIFIYFWGEFGSLFMDAIKVQYMYL